MKVEAERQKVECGRVPGSPATALYFFINILPSSFSRQQTPAPGKSCWIRWDVQAHNGGDAEDIVRI